MAGDLAALSAVVPAPADGSGAGKSRALTPTTDGKHDARGATPRLHGGGPHVTGDCAMGFSDAETVQRVELLLKELNLSPEDRLVVRPARDVARGRAGTELGQ